MKQYKWAVKDKNDGQWLGHILDMPTFCIYNKTDRQVFDTKEEAKAALSFYRNRTALWGFNLRPVFVRVRVG